jgi:hypothetical protein
LEHLQIGGNHIGKHGCIALSEALKVNTSLEEFHGPPEVDLSSIFARKV